MIPIILAPQIFGVDGAHSSSDYIPAIRTYEKVGFQPVGVMRRYELGPDGTFHDGLLRDLLTEEFIRQQHLAGRASLAQMISNMRRAQWLARI